MNYDTKPADRESDAERQLPCNRGYQEPLHRCESDRLFRARLSETLVGGKQKLDRHLAHQVDQGILSSLAVGERLKSRIDQLLQAIRSSGDANSPLLDSQRWSDREAGEIDALENTLLQTSAAIAELADGLTKQEATSRDAIGRMSGLIDELAAGFDTRLQRIETIGV
ncbi:hypothetical protein CA51_23680 [Rosistilla oblonga]|uniref:hypothetical protein n=1 Tax=Rosistilla oblonga TaxID=2527990 RepID=UPI00118A3800|nr:hypothetical protein [Rosistilla oblonga]QDV12485.1 hypothetical protein CA51_23680 [Rosistilla oblonga]